MKFDTSKISGFDAMSDEEKVKALLGTDLPEPDYSGFVSKETFDKKASELAEMNKKYRSSLDDTEREKLETKELIEGLQNQVKALESEKQLSDLTGKYMSIGYEEKFAKETAKAFMDGDMNRVFNNQKKFLEQREADWKASALQSTPQPPAGEGTKAPDRDSLKKMSLAEKQKMYESDPDSYKEIYGGN